VTDGEGSWSLCEVGDVGLHRVTSVEVDVETPETTLYLAPLKGDRSEWVVAKATELGVSRVVPLVSERLVVKFKVTFARRSSRAGDESPPKPTGSAVARVSCTSTNRCTCVTFRERRGLRL